MKILQGLGLSSCTTIWQNISTQLAQGGVYRVWFLASTSACANYRCFEVKQKPGSFKELTRTPVQCSATELRQLHKQPPAFTYLLFHIKTIFNMRYQVSSIVGGCLPSPPSWICRFQIVGSAHPPGLCSGLGGRVQNILTANQALVTLEQRLNLKGNFVCYLSLK